MALVIETGAGIAGANSFVTDAEYTTYTTARGLTVGLDATAREIELITAMDYLFSREPNMKGRRTLDDQENIYPRQDVLIRGVSLDNDRIPIELKKFSNGGWISSKCF